MADVKYPDYTPVDEPVRTGTKPQEPGSAIRVAPEDKYSEYKKQIENEQANRDSDSTKGALMLKAGMEMMKGLGKPKLPEKKAKGGTASSRADGICQRGKTKGTYL